MSIYSHSFDPSYQSSLNHLCDAAAHFNRGNSLMGYWNFEAAGEEGQCRVYKQLWIDQGSRLGNLEYGREAFHNRHGLSSTNQERAGAIASYMRLKIEEIGEASEGRSIKKHMPSFHHAIHGNFSLIALDRAAVSFWHESKWGRFHFESANLEDQRGVYQQLLTDRGCPERNLKFGEDAFYNRNGLSSSGQEKTNSIDGYLRSKIEEMNGVFERRITNPALTVQSFSASSEAFRGEEVGTIIRPVVASVPHSQALAQPISEDLVILFFIVFCFPLGLLLAVAKRAGDQR